jgi:hypothetical protein
MVSMVIANDSKCNMKRFVGELVVDLWEGESQFGEGQRNRTYLVSNWQVSNTGIVPNKNHSWTRESQSRRKVSLHTFRYANGKTRGEISPGRDQNSISNEMVRPRGNQKRLLSVSLPVICQVGIELKL